MKKRIRYKVNGKMRIESIDITEEEKAQRMANPSISMENFVKTESPIIHRSIRKIAATYNYQLLTEQNILDLEQDFYIRLIEKWPIECWMDKSWNKWRRISKKVEENYYSGAINTYYFQPLNSIVCNFINKQNKLFRKELIKHREKATLIRELKIRGIPFDMKEIYWEEGFFVYELEQNYKEVDLVYHGPDGEYINPEVDEQHSTEINEELAIVPTLLEMLDKETKGTDENRIAKNKKRGKSTNCKTEMLDMMLKEYTPKEIAMSFNFSPQTFNAHKNSIKRMAFTIADKLRLDLTGYRPLVKKKKRRKKDVSI